MHGGSGLLCYEAMFGYRLEEFDRGSLDPGPVTAARIVALRDVARGNWLDRLFR